MLCLNCNPAAAGAGVVTVTLGATSSGNDMSLVRGGRVSGTVTGPNGTPLQGVFVDLFADPSQQAAVVGLTNQSGGYTTGAGLPWLIALPPSQPGPRRSTCRAASPGRTAPCPFMHSSQCAPIIRP